MLQMHFMGHSSMRGWWLQHHGAPGSLQHVQASCPSTAAPTGNMHRQKDNCNWDCAAFLQAVCVLHVWSCFVVAATLQPLYTDVCLQSFIVCSLETLGNVPNPGTESGKGPLATAHWQFTTHAGYGPEHPACVQQIDAAAHLALCLQTGSHGTPAASIFLLVAVQWEPRSCRLQLHVAGPASGCSNSSSAQQAAPGLHNLCLLPS